MADNLPALFAKFRKDLLPDIDRVVGVRVDALRDEWVAAIGSLRSEMLSHFDDLYKRLDRVEKEYYMLIAAVRRLEEQMAAVEQKLDRLALRSELLALKEQVVQLEHRITELEKTLN